MISATAAAIDVNLVEWIGIQVVEMVLEKWRRRKVNVD